MSIIFNSTTPAAPAGGKNITWQTDMSGNVSGYVSGAGSRNTFAHTTASLANNANENANTFAIAPSFALYKLTVSAYCRVRLYSTFALSTADISRAFNVPPVAGSQNGIICDLQLDSSYGSLSFILSPALLGANVEASPSANISYNITNLSGSTAAITATFTAVPLE